MNGDPNDPVTPTEQDDPIPADEDIEVGAWMGDRPEEPEDEPLPDPDGDL